MTDAAQPDPVSVLMQLLHERWVLTLAQSDPASDAPYATPLFYALAEPDTLGQHAGPILVLISDPGTHHGTLAGVEPSSAAAGIYLESEDIGELRGVQVRGTLLREEGWTETGARLLRETYLARHPAAAEPLGSGHYRLYGLLLTWAKTTDNRVGFGYHGEVRFDGACSEVKPSLGE